MQHVILFAFDKDINTLCWKHSVTEDLKRKSFLGSKTKTHEQKLALALTDCLLKITWTMWLSDAGIAS